MITLLAALLILGCSTADTRDVGSGLGPTAVPPGASSTGSESDDIGDEPAASSEDEADTADADSADDGGVDGGVLFDMGDAPEPPGPVAFDPIPATCDAAIDASTTVGCTFLAVDLDSHDNVESSQYAVVVSNPQQVTATVTVEVASPMGWSPVAGPQTIDAIDLATFPLPDLHQDDSGLKVDGSYRITSDVPVVAYQFNPLDGANSYLSDASMLYPLESWDWAYTAVTWPATDDGDPQGTYVTIVAAHDGTVVEVTPSVPTLAGPAVPAGSPGVPFQLTLGAGDVAEVMTKTFGVSLTGTRIESDEDHPIAVFAGHECAWVPENFGSCDHLEEQLSSSRFWGTHYIAARFPPRNDGQSEPTVWQIAATADGTVVELFADPGVVGLPPGGSLVLDAGDVAELTVSGTSAHPGNFEIVASDPIGVFAYMTGEQVLDSGATGDPAVVQLNPIAQFLDRYVVLVPSTWEQDVAIVTRPAGSMTMLDGAVLDDGLFAEVAASGFEVAVVDVSDGTHRFEGSDPLSIIVAGYDAFDSYAYLGGTGAAVIHPEG